LSLFIFLFVCFLRRGNLDFVAFAPFCQNGRIAILAFYALHAVMAVSQPIAQQKFLLLSTDFHRFAHFFYLKT